MKQADKAAIEGSIEKWKAIVSGEKPDRGVTDCPLCKIYLEPSCDGCPIKIDSEYGGCVGTPYTRWNELFIHTNKSGYWATTKQQKEAAKDMLEYLMALLWMDSEYKRGVYERFKAEILRRDPYLSTFQVMKEAIRMDNYGLH